MRIEELSEDVKCNQQNQLNNLEYLSIAIDEITYTTHIAQLRIFIRGIFSNFGMFEDFLLLIPNRNL